MAKEPHISDLAADEIVITPMMQTLTSMFVVKKPDGELAPPKIGEFGGMSLGAHHIAGVGAVMSIALHHPDGTTLVGTFGFDGYCEIAEGFNAWGERMNAGEFDQPVVAS